MERDRLLWIWEKFWDKKGKVKQRKNYIMNFGFFVQLIIVRPWVDNSIV